MYKIEKLNSYNKIHIKNLNFKAKAFNKYNEDIHEYLIENPWLKRILLGDKIHLLKINDKYEGFVWYARGMNGTFNIKSLYISPEKCSEDYLRYFSEKIFKDLNGSVFYDCIYNYDTALILNNLGFDINMSFIELCLDLNSLESFTLQNYDKDIENFLENFHEKTRCYIQNEVFFSENRIPLNVNDIIYEEKQNFYIKNGGLLLKYNNKYIGYGQIIFVNDEPYIVNVGVLSEFRHLGFGTKLMKSLINRCKEIGYEKVYIRCYENNITALNLYKKLGFKEVARMFNWIKN